MYGINLIICFFPAQEANKGATGVTTKLQITLYQPAVEDGSAVKASGLQVSA